MKKFLIINLLLLSILVSFLPTVNASVLTEIVDENGNVPAYEYYPNHVASRSIKALKAYDGKIFMGLGDWNDNTGPVKVLYYDTTDGKVKTSGTISDEAIQDFTIINNKLYTTGCDPKETWGYGSYYIYNKETNKWDQHLKNNGWVHVFHMTEFKDKIFMSGEITGNEYSHIQYTIDDGKTFINTKIVNNGTDISHYTDLRCYNMVSYNGNLYAFIKHQNSNTYKGIYLYDEANNQFNYYSSLPSSSYSIYSISSLVSHNNYYMNHEVFNNEFLFVSGSVLYKSTDLKTFNKIKTNTKDVVQDVVISGDTLYTLSYVYNSDKTFTTRIYSTKDLTNFNLLYEFTADAAPVCLEYYDNTIYVGTGIYSNNDNKLGSLYKVDLDSIDIDNIITNTTINNTTINNADNNSNTNTNTNTSTHSNNTNNSQIKDYINDNTKLPQTGKFFEFTNLLQLIIIVSVLLLIFIILKEKKLNTTKNKKE